MKNKIPEFNLTSVNSVFILRELNGKIVRVSRSVPKSFFNMKPITNEILYDTEEDEYWNKNSDIIYDFRAKRKFFQEEYINVTKSLLEKQKLESELLLDPLTQIPNIAAINQKEFEMIKNNKSYVIAMCDINDFKSINDTYGHQMGDKILIDVAKILNSNNRANADMTARIGGDEFQFIFETEDITTILEKLANLKSKVKEYGDTLGFPVSVSIGASFLKQHDKNGLRTLDEIKAKKEEADKALYYVKKNVKNTDDIAYYYSDTNEIDVYSMTGNRERRKLINILSKIKRD